MTRAKNELILTRSERQSNYSFSYVDATEAYFLSTLPDTLVENHWPDELYFDEDGDFYDYSVIRPQNKTLNERK